jgi:hypothetical protein
VLAEASYYYSTTMLAARASLSSPGTADAASSSEPAAVATEVAESGATASGTESADVFLSHAGTEKQHVVNVLHHRLTERGISTFVDYAMPIGTDATQAMLSAAATTARVGVLVLSRAFFRREWPVREARIMHERYMRSPRSMELVILFNDVKPWATLHDDGLQGDAQALFNQLCAITGHERQPKELLMTTVDTIADAVERLLPQGRKRTSPRARGA